MKASEIRRRFLDFYKDRGHEVVSSAAVIPHGDPTLMFTNAGMNQFKDVFLGREQRSYKRAASAQKCIRAGGKHNDLENVGLTARHQTFFEMLGNFSFGDYFKREAIVWAWELLIEVYGFDSERLHATVFEDDAEAHGLWLEQIGLPAERVHRLGAKDNFWSMGDTGPCGPCSEIFFDRGDEHSCGDDCGIGRCECDRFIEFYNLVFMQFDQAADGSRTELPAPSVDTGMGLERVVMLLQGKSSNYDTDLLLPVIDEVAEASGVAYDTGEAGVPHRVVADHVRALTSSIADGALPSNQGRGYVLRRILRRASRFGRKLGMERPFIHGLVGKVVESLGDTYPEMVERREHIERVIRSEEESFNRTLDRGLALFDEIAEAASESGLQMVAGGDAFRLYDTYGFPVDLTQLMARERGLGVDMESYSECLLEAQRVSAGGRAFKPTSLEGHATIDQPTTFVGNDLTVSMEAAVLSATDTELIIDRTPFYAEGGGQVGDVGLLASCDPGADGRFDFEFSVEDTQRVGDVIVHRGSFIKGGAEAAAEGVPVVSQVDAARRAAICKNHSGTHLLHWALRKVLGDHACQRGSLVRDDMLRFDFEHTSAMRDGEIEEVERLVNEKVLLDQEVCAHETTYDQAISDGVVALFGEKYGESVRVVDIGGFSKELCGGTHCGRAGEIGYLKLVSEGSIGSNLRRVVARTGLFSVQDALEDRRLIQGLCRELKTDAAGLYRKVLAMTEQVKELKSKKSQSSAVDLGQTARRLLESATQEGTIWTVVAQLEGLGIPELRQICDQLRRDGRPMAVMLASVQDGRVQLLSIVTKDIAGKVVSARSILAEVGPLVGGKGGGRDDMAQGGGKDAAAVPKALERAAAMIKEAAASQG